jgi:hypothetical protein
LDLSPCRPCTQKMCSLLPWYTEFNYSILSQIMYMCILYRGYPRDSKFQNSEYGLHLIGSKDFGSRNFSFLAFKKKAISVVQILRTATTRRVTDEKKLSLKSCYLDLFQEFQKNRLSRSGCWPKFV